MRFAIIWFPVILIMNSGDPAEAAAYKIGTAIVFGAMTLIPFHKQTMLSIEGTGATAFLESIATSAILFSGLGAVLLIGLAEPLTRHLFKADFHRLSEYMPSLGLFLILQCLVDIVLVRMISAKRDYLLVVSCLASVVCGMVGLLYIQPRWYPALCAGVFCLMFVCLPHRSSLGPDIFRGAFASIMSAGTAYFVGGLRGMAVGIGLLAFSLGADRRLRQCAVRGILYFTSPRGTEFGV
jgi:hypothetical protein